MSESYILTYYVPEVSAEDVSKACFNAGAGVVGAYTHCAWSVLGQGQFYPLEGAHPSIGQSGQLTYVTEARVEMRCPAAAWSKVEAALIQAHPYETPVYFIQPSLAITQ
mgnify:CR=1 FL=1